MLVVANWKMRLDVKQSVALADAVRSAVPRQPDVTVVLCPTHVSLNAVAARLKGSPIALGAQDCFWEVSGAYTGEISPTDLRAQGTGYVLIGHSERRQYLGETDEQVHRKVVAALRAGLTPIVCVGEDYQQRAERQKDYILLRQVQVAFQGMTLGPEDRVVVAYEPVWAISTGGVGIEATPDEVQYASEVIAHSVKDLWGKIALERQVAIVYGGNVNADNVAAFTALPAIGGVLVGSASLNVEEFVQVIEAAVRGGS